MASSIFGTLEIEERYNNISPFGKQSLKILKSKFQGVADFASVDNAGNYKLSAVDLTLQSSRTEEVVQFVLYCTVKVDKIALYIQYTISTVGYNPYHLV